MATTDPKLHKAEIAEARRRLGDAEKSFEVNVAAARRALGVAESAHRDSVRVAERAATQAASRRAKDIAEAEQSVAAAKLGHKLTGYARALTVYDNRLETSGRQTPLSTAIRASVEVSGQKTDKTDSREVVLLLDTPDFNDVIRCDPNHATLAREVAAAVNTAAKNAESHIRAHEDRRASTEKQLRDVQADTRQVDEATAALSAARADTDASVRAQTELEKVLAETREVNAARERLLALDPKAKTRSLDALQRESLRGRLARRWSGRSKRGKALLVVLGVISALVVLGAVAAMGDSTRTTPHEVATKPSRTAAQPTASVPTVKTVELSLTRPAFASGGPTVRTDSLEVRGFATPGAVVVINGSAARRDGARFSMRMHLKHGVNKIKIRVTKAHMKSRSALITVERGLPLVGLRARSAATVQSSQVTISGTAVSGALLTVNGNAVGSATPGFSATVDLKEGANSLVVRASKEGFEAEEIRLRVIRRLSPAEVAAAVEQRRQSFIDSTVVIPYNQLIKDPDSFAGRRVRYHGEILQIQESGGMGFMLLYVTNLGYDIWTDQIWVSYTNHVRGAQGDELTVYGTVVGTKSYDTQIGGTTYVPEVEAVYIDE